MLHTSSIINGPGSNVLERCDDLARTKVRAVREGCVLHISGNPSTDILDPGEGNLIIPSSPLKIAPNKQYSRVLANPTSTGIK